MAFEQTVTVPGDQTTYQLNPELKRYALTDAGFAKNNAGDYVMERALEPKKGLKKSVRLKVVVNAALDGMKIKTVNPSGNAIVDIFKLKDADPIVELYGYYLDDLKERGVLAN